jgi:predicted ABC-type ATPase
VKAETPRLRMFAGPNGSGKSVLKSYLPTELLGVYLNADEMEMAVKGTGGLYLRDFAVNAEKEDVFGFFAKSQLLKNAGLQQSVKQVKFDAGFLDFSAVDMNSYFASVTADFLRTKLIENRISFTFETVMSHPSKVDLLVDAQSRG